MKSLNKEILDHVISIKEDVAGIKEHLRQLNSKVATHELKIHENRIQNDVCHAKIEDKLATLDKYQAILALKIGGVVGVVIFIVQFALNRFL